jgi:hypothetical protein
MNNIGLRFITKSGGSGGMIYTRFNFNLVRRNTEIFWLEFPVFYHDVTQGKG